MVIKKVNLDIVVGVTSTLPETSFPEVAFAGKSNVGKSSLINALMNRKSYASSDSAHHAFNPAHDAAGQREELH